MHNLQCTCIYSHVDQITIFLQSRAALKLGLISISIEVLHCNNHVAWQEQRNYFAWERNFFHKKKNLLFLRCNMAAIQNLCFEKKYHIWLSAMFPRKWHIKFHASYNILLWISWYFWFMNVCYSSNIVKFQKISRPPQRKGLFLRPPSPPNPSGNSN